MSSRFPRTERRVALTLVLALMASLAVATAQPTMQPAFADDSPPPLCFEAWNWTEANPVERCLESDNAVSISGAIGEGRTMTATMSFAASPCANADQVDCFRGFNLFAQSICVSQIAEDRWREVPCGTVFRMESGAGLGPWAVQDVVQCSEGFNSTYYYGGPPGQHFVPRVNAFDSCTWTTLRPDWIQPLPAPTWAFWRGRLNMHHGHGVSGSWIDGYAAVRVIGPDTGPTASFDHTVSGTVPGQVVFESTSTHPQGEPLTHQWGLGDGSGSSATAFTHVYERPGEYPVTLRVVDPDGAEDSVTKTVEVPAPPLTVVLDLPEGGTVPIGAPFEVELQLMAPVSVGGLATVGNLDAVMPVGDDALRIPDGFEILEGPDIPEGGLTLEPGAGPTTLRWTLQAAAPGPFTLRSAWQGLDAAGRMAGPVDAEVNGAAAGLDVEVEVRYPQPPEGSEVDVGPPGFQKDNNGDGIIDEADHRIEVVVTATNRSDETLREVGPLGGAGHVVRFSNRLLGDGQVSLQPIEQPHQVSFGDLEPDVPVERTYVFEAMGEVRAEARALLEGVPESGGVVRGVGTADVRFTSDLAVEVEIGLEQRAYTSGDTVRLFGTVRSLVADEVDESGAVLEEAPDVAVVISPIVEGNAGNGHISIAGGSSRTPIAEELILLGPEEEVDISAILLTQGTEEPSEAGVRYLVRAWEITEDGEPAVEIDPSRIVISEDDPFSAEHETTLEAYDFTPDDVRECVTVVVDDIVSCNLYVGVRNLALGLWDLAALVPEGLGELGNAASRTSAWGLHTGTNALRGVLGDPAAQQAILTEIEVQIETFRELGIMTGDTTMTAADALVEFLDEAEQVIESGDGEEMLAFLSRQAGENIDMTVGGLTKIRALAIIQRSNADAAARTPAATATREARERAAREAQDGVEQRVRESRNRGDDPATDGTFRGNEDVTDIPAVTRGVYGTDTRTLDNIRSIAASENVLIGWRSRSPIVAELYRLGQIYLKPMDVKAKTVNVIDVNYLGYRRSSMGRVELTEPPIDYRLAAPGNELAFRNAVDDHMATLRSRHPEIAADPLWEAEVRKRLELRTREYPKQLREFQRYHYEGIRLEFGYDQQGLPATHSAEVTEIRRAQVRGVVAAGEDGVVRRYLQLEMDGPGNNGAFRQIGGDTDVVLIQNPDRTPLTDPDKRRRIYEALQEQIGMQHGETMTYINAEVQAKLLRDHVAGRTGAEALLIAGPDGRVRMGYLEEVFSSRLGPDGEPIGSIFNLVSGAPAELLSSATVGQASSFAGYLERINAHMARLPFYLPGRLAHLAASLGPEQLFPAFDVDGLLLQPDGRGGVVVYDADGGQDAQPGGQDAPGGAAPLATDGDPGPGDPDGQLLDQLVDEVRDAGLLPDGPPDVGAAGGQWKPIDVEEALAAGGGQVRLAPMTSLTEDVEAGDTHLPTHGVEGMAMSDEGDWFEPGDIVVIDPGGHLEEVATVAELGSLVLSAPLINDHHAGTAILRLGTTGTVDVPDESDVGASDPLPEGDDAPGADAEGVDGGDPGVVGPPGVGADDPSGADAEGVDGGDPGVVGPPEVEIDDPPASDAEAVDGEDPGVVGPPEVGTDDPPASDEEGVGAGDLISVWPPGVGADDPSGPDEEAVDGGEPEVLDAGLEDRDPAGPPGAATDADGAPGTGVQDDERIVVLEEVVERRVQALVRTGAPVHSLLVFAVLLALIGLMLLRAGRTRGEPPVPRVLARSP